MKRKRRFSNEIREIFACRMESHLGAREGVLRSIVEELNARGIAFDPHLHYLCLDEALINAVVHGNRDDPSKAVKVRVFLLEDGWGAEVEDEGAGFDWAKWQRRLRAGMDTSRTSGRGLELIFNSGAEVEFLDGGRRLRIIWRESLPEESHD